MSRRRAQIVLVCEDSQHEAFARRFLKQRGRGPRQIRVEKAPTARGSGEQFVRKRFPAELDAIRRGHVDRAVVVMIDGDRHGRDGRLSQLDEACRSAGVEPPTANDQAAIIVPTWSIETWFAYLDGKSVDEGRRGYHSLPHERDCSKHVEALVRMCEQARLRQPAPPSLEASCIDQRLQALLEARG